VRSDRITYLRNDTPTGVARARNRGVSEARGEWIAFLDDDDFWAPTKLRSQLDACAAKGADFSYTGLVVTDEALELREIASPPPAESLGRDLLGMNVIGPPSCVMASRPLLERVGGFDPSFSILADWDLWLRLVAGGRPAACDAPLTAYVTHPSNMHLDADGALAEFRRLRPKHAELAAAQDRRIGNERWWGWIAFSFLRSGRRYRAAALFLWLGLRFRRPRVLARAAAILLGDRVAGRVRSALPQRRGETDAAAPAAAGWLDAFGASGAD